MLPTYRPGDTLLGWRWFWPRAGQAVVARHENQPIIKRIGRVTPEGLYLLGDNPGRSTDSRHLGLIPASQLEAKIIAKLL